MIIDVNDVAVSSIVACAGAADIKLLEIGCGDGRITCCLHAEYDRLVAIDPDVAAINRAREEYPQIDFRVGSGEFLDFAEKTFDVVLFSLSLHHQNGEKALQQVKRVLAPGGKVLVVEPAVDSHMSQLGYIFEDESAELMKAIDQIKDSDFEVFSKSNVSTKWLFQDNHELYDWLFEYYNQQPTQDKLREIDSFLGDTKREKPITISDTLVLTQLSLPTI